MKLTKFVRFVLLIAFTLLIVETFSAETIVSHSRMEATTIMAQSVSATGTLEKQGITSYQYGTHVLKDGKKTIYALTSKSVKLGDYAGKKVTITGTLIDGYPLDGGPAFVEVTSIEVAK